MTACSLLGFGIALPPHSIGQREAAQIVVGFGCETDEQRQFVRGVYEQSAIDQRHSVVLQRGDGPLSERQAFFQSATESGDRGPTTAARMRAYAGGATALAEEAARGALAEAGIVATEITHLISVTCTGFHAPGFDIGLFAALGLSAEASRVQLGFMGCHGALNALRVAAAFVEQNPQAKVLVVAVELCSLHQQYGFRPDQIVANALFADGAAAVVCGARRRAEDDELVANGSVLWPGSEDAMTWGIGDHGFEMTLSRKVPQLIRRHLRPWLAEWLSRHHVSLAEVGDWAIHPGGPRIIASVAESLELSSEQTQPSEAILRTYGNMSSPTILFILRSLARRGGGPLVALAFGPGLVCEAALIRRG